MKHFTHLHRSCKCWTYKVNVHCVDYYRYTIDHFVYETVIGNGKYFLLLNEQIITLKIMS